MIKIYLVINDNCLRNKKITVIFYYNKIMTIQIYTTAERGQNLITNFK